MNSKSSNQNKACTGSAPNICLPLDDEERLCWLGHICHHCPLHSWHLAAVSLGVPGAMKGSSGKCRFIVLIHKNRGKGPPQPFHRAAN